MLTLDSKTHKMKHVDTVHCSGFRKCEIKQTISNALEHKLSMPSSNSWYVSVLYHKTSCGVCYSDRLFGGNNHEIFSLLLSRL